MPVKRTLRLEEKENETPARKRPVPDRNYSPVTGTRFMSPVPSPKGNLTARRNTDNPSKTQKPQTDAEKLNALRSNVSVKAFKKVCQQLEKIVPTEGSSELRTFFFRGSADLQTELLRNKELFSKVEKHLKGGDTHPSKFQGFAKPGSSYEFLKSILN
ncbi:hypothetical protein AGOR_G00150610 [Albula goreensis]|uniref:Uncharacterized protein n=1 Tax=Albula goreensis TaxID=1534307 RepID=A0A8T3D7R9_9TELE|nr:hypothetical protein AGOR_G00150610 [Albula goreensis]